MVYDLDLAGELGYVKKRMIRKLIKHLIDNGKIGPSGLRSTVERNPAQGPPVTAYYLGQFAALKVVTKSETTKAEGISTF